MCQCVCVCVCVFKHAYIYLHIYNTLIYILVFVDSMKLLNTLKHPCKFYFAITHNLFIHSFFPVNKIVTVCDFKQNMFLSRLLTKISSNYLTFPNAFLVLGKYFDIYFNILPCFDEQTKSELSKQGHFLPLARQFGLKY